MAWPRMPSFSPRYSRSINLHLSKVSLFYRNDSSLYPSRNTFAPFLLLHRDGSFNFLYRLSYRSMEGGGGKKFIHRDKSRERSLSRGLYYFLSGRRIVGEFMDSEGKWNRAGEARVIKGIIKRWDLQKSRRYISIQKFSPSFSLIEIHILFKKNM